MAGIDSFTVLMLHCNGSDLSTTIIDSSSAAHSMTAQSTAVLSTTTPKFGTAALLLDGLTAYVTTGDSTDFDFPGDFTIDLWIRQTSTGGDYCMYDRNVNQCFFSLTGVNTVWVGINGAQSTTFAFTEDVTTYHHMAWVRSGSTNTVYADGTSIGTYTNSAAIDEATGIDIGRRSNGTWFFPGRMDEYRISKGIARWTANFTPPTAEYTQASYFSQLMMKGMG